ncbi:MAG TPA: hypothetical protein VGZ22_14030 [Isosphaeraceae bacterium]|nr:hypothetical protein [Isosphaeraceae bacterium]
MALVFWLLFARDEGTVLLAIFGYLAFSLVLLVVLPMYFLHRRCPECRERAMFCMGIVLVQPPLTSYYCCATCFTQYRRQVFRAWTRLPETLPALMFPQRRRANVIDPLVWYADPALPRPTEEPAITFLEDPEP